MDNIPDFPEETTPPKGPEPKKFTAKKTVANVKKKVAKKTVAIKKTDPPAPSIPPKKVSTSINASRKSTAKEESPESPKESSSEEQSDHTSSTLRKFLDENSPPTTTKSKSQHSVQTSSGIPAPSVKESEKSSNPLIPTAPRKKIKSTSTTDDEDSKTKKPWTTIEKITVLIFTLLILTIAAAGFYYVKRQIPSGGSSKAIKSYAFPVKGKFCEIQSVETAWRTPKSTGPNPDFGVLPDIKLIPISRISINPESFPGTLRIIFRKPDGSVAGDVNSHAFKDGKFSVSYEPTLEVICTGGFRNKGEHAAYAAQQDNHWTIEILEGSADAASMKEFTSLLTVPISRLIQ